MCVLYVYIDIGRILLYVHINIGRSVQDLLDLLKSRAVSYGWQIWNIRIRILRKYKANISCDNVALLVWRHNMFIHTGVISLYYSWNPEVSWYIIIITWTDDWFRALCFCHLLFIHFPVLDILTLHNF